MTIHQLIGTIKLEKFMNSKMIFRSIIVVIILICTIPLITNAQPYYYSVKQEYNNFFNIHRYNLSSGIDEVFFKTNTKELKYFDIRWDNTQRWIYFSFQDIKTDNVNKATVINSTDTSIYHTFPDYGSFLDIDHKLDSRIKALNGGIVFNPILNQFYVTFRTSYNSTDYFWANPKTFVYNAVNFKLIDSIAGRLPSFMNEGCSISQDGKTLFIEEWMQYNTIKLHQIENLSVETKVRDITLIGDPNNFKIVNDNKMGMFLISYKWPAQTNHLTYLIYDLSNDKIITKIAYDGNNFGYLSGDGKYLIVEETPTNPDPSPTAEPRFHPGRISVFNGLTGSLIQKLTLSPDGKVLVFDNYPNMLYYYLPGEQRSINIDLSKLSPPSGCNVKLVNSTGAKLTGGALQYYEGSPQGAGWKDAVNNNDGTFFVNTTAKTLSLRMTYEYGTQTKSNVTVGYDTVAFQTVNAQIQLQNSIGVLIDTGSVQYYAGAWRNLGTTTNGIAAKELLPANYSFRMTYAYASKDKQQDIGTNATVVFQTVNAAVQLQNSQGTLIDQGTVQYYSGAWRDLGVTTSGVAKKELLPNNYSFRMTYAYASKDKQQDISTNPTVVFQTVNVAVQLQNSQGTLIDQGTVQYYSGAWRDLGTTTSGIAKKELLPNNYSFRMTYAYASKDKAQDITTNATVVFQTVNAAVQLQNSQGTLMDQGTVQYYSGAWRDLGTTTNGIAKKELLPNNYSFRMTYEYVSLDKAQDISTNNTVNFSTVLCTIRVKNSQNQLVNNAMASYYSGAWRQIGNTVNGLITKELFPVNLSFRIKYGTQQQDKQQNLSTNAVVEFGIQ